jgi:hypothetical protein
MPSAAIPAAGVPPDARGLDDSGPLLRYTAPFDMSRNPTLSLPCGPAAGDVAAAARLYGRERSARPCR